ncbi:N-arachidonyl glycine receptor-like [Petromyzon marinus]|uniref:N-arachidonyl glycine receptor-like n=1 Tax=Petromyzon marinus TaxID=7757 RepID=UPI003F7267D5
MAFGDANATAVGGAYDESLWSQRWYAALNSVVYSVTFVAGCLINGLALWVFTHTSKKNKVHIFMINLTIAHLIAIAFIPFRLFHFITGGWSLGKSFCRVLVAARCVFSAATLWFFTCISVEHYLAVVHKVAAGPIRRAKVYRLASAAVWLLVATQIPPIMLTEEASKAVCSGSCHKMSVITCWREIWLQQLVMTIFHFLAPFAVITVTYFHIVRFLLGKRHHGGGGRVNVGGSLSGKKGRSKPLRIIFTIIALLAGFYMPYHIGMAIHLGTRWFWSDVADGCGGSSGAIIACLSLLMDVSCCALFPLYFLVSKYFRQRFHSVLVYQRYLSRLTRKRRASVAMDSLE